MGDKLDPQIIFEGTTNRCLPKVDKTGLLFSKTYNHWQNEASTKEWLVEVAFPWYDYHLKDCSVFNH